MSEDDMALFDPPKPDKVDFGGGGEESPTDPKKQKEQLDSAIATIENINASVEQLAMMATSVGWGDLKTHVPGLFPAIEDLKSFAEDLQHRLKGH